ncbi:MAG: PHP domain-containing protein [Bacteroidales bacterium]
MKRKFNYHTHTKYCDGADAPRAYVEEAIKLGFSTLGFSSHAPTKEKNTFSLQMDEVPLYVSEIRALQTEYASQIKVLLSLEMDYIPGHTYPF